MLKYVLGLDGGGTKTEVICADEEGNILSQGVSGPTNLSAVDKETAGLNFLAAVEQVTSQLVPDSSCEALVFGLAGVDTPDEVIFARDFFSKKLTQIEVKDFTVINDIELVLAAGASHPDAVAVIAGTGSNCFGRNQKGQTAQTSGMDFLLADEGSGYEIGRKVLRAATSSYDGRAAKTELETLLLQHFQTDSFVRLKEKIYDPILSKAQIAELAKICGIAAEHGDEAAKKIINETVDELFLIISTVVNKLELNQIDMDVIAAGSILKQSSVFDPLQQKLKNHYPQLEFKFLEKSPVYGAVNIALEKL